MTLDTEGAIVGGADGTPRRSHSTPVPASHCVGAGDAYLAAMLLALAAGRVPVAAELAQLAAIATLGGRDLRLPPGRLLDAVAPEDRPTGRGRRRRAGGHRPPAPRARRPDRVHQRLLRRAAPGPRRLPGQARELGDVLIVAVNSDQSVRRLKGPQRPVNQVEDRVAVLAALACVDHVVVFEEDSPAALIEAIRPDVYVKGGDYPPELVPEAPLVRGLHGEVRTLGYVPDRSTSAIIDRIRAQPSRPPPARPPGPPPARPPRPSAGPPPTVVPRRYGPPPIRRRHPGGTRRLPTRPRPRPQRVWAGPREPTARPRHDRGSSADPAGSTCLIPTRNRPAELSVTLAGLAAQVEVPDFGVVVSDQSDDDPD